MDLRPTVYAACLATLAALAFDPVAAKADTAAAPAVQTAADYQIVPANSRPWRQHMMHRQWDRHRDGVRCTRWGNNCRHYYRGYYYANPWWIIPPIVGGVIAGQSYYHGGGSAHVRWCMDHYRSYNPRTNTWVAYGGEVRRCVSPYSR